VLKLSLEPLVVEKMDMGPCITTFGPDQLGRTKGETKFNYSIDTQKIETEEDGLIDEVVIDDLLAITIPFIYTDINTLALLIPWAQKVTDGTNTKLEVGKAIGKRLFQYAKALTIHPMSAEDTDLSKDLNVYKCYPKPGPIDLTYSRTGERIANVTFNAVRDGSKPVGKDYFCVGDPSISADIVLPTVSSTVPIDDAVGVAKALGLTVDFVMSEPIDPATVTKDNTTFVNDATEAAFNLYTVSYITASNTIRLTTSGALVGTTKYQVTLSTGIKDLNGNALAEPKVLTFTTAA
jgi:hypothetical protein